MHRPVCPSMSLMEKVSISEVTISNRNVTIGFFNVAIYVAIYFADLKTKSINTQKSNDLAEAPSSSTESIASCSSKSDEPKEVKSADSTTDEPKTNEIETENEIEKDKDEKPEKDGEEGEGEEKSSDTNAEPDKEETADKSDDETACGSSSPKPETELNESDDQKDDLASSTSKLSTNEENSASDDTLIDVEDPDDYLLYLESILMKIHSRFYTHYDETKQVRILRVRTDLFNCFDKFEFIIEFRLDLYVDT